MKAQACSWVLLITGLGGLGLIACEAFGQDAQVALLIDDLAQGRNPRDARRKLKNMEDRPLVLGALRSALDEEGGTVKGKMALLKTLEDLDAARLVRSALGSPSVTAQRAAAFLLQGDTELRSQVTPIALTWLMDPLADSQDLAVRIRDRLDVVEAVPALRELVDTAKKSVEDAVLLKHALLALSGFNVAGLGPSVIALARDPQQDRRVRCAAFEMLGRLEDVPRDEVQQLMINTLTDADTEIRLRYRAMSVLRNKLYGDQESVAALEKVLFDPKEADWPGGDQKKRGQHWIVQRGCLRTLSEIAPLDRLRELLLDERVSRHPYFGVRADVATGIASLRLADRAAFDTLCEYLVDEDPRDELHVVRRDAWLSLWTLTGLAYGVPCPERFAIPPEPLRDEQSLRQRLFGPRPGVFPEQFRIVRDAVVDLAEMKKARHAFRRKWEVIKERLEQASEAK